MPANDLRQGAAIMFQRMNRNDIERYRATHSYPEYVAFLNDLRKGEGGRVDVVATGVGRQTVKNRLKASASASGMQIKFLRSRPTDVIFEVLAKAQV
jgi:hypothetical protein